MLRAVYGMQADITFGHGDGPVAAEFIRSQLAAVPALRPLCLVVKALLRHSALNDASTGGLASHAVFLMVSWRSMAALPCHMQVPQAYCGCTSRPPGGAGWQLDRRPREEARSLPGGAGCCPFQFVIDTRPLPSLCASVHAVWPRMGA